MNKNNLIKEIENLDQALNIFLSLMEKNDVLQNSKYYFYFCKKKEILDFNIRIDEDDFHENFLFIGEDEINNLIAININNRKIYCLTVLSDEEDAVELADNIIDFLLKFYRNEIEIF